MRTAILAAGMLLVGLVVGFLGGVAASPAHEQAQAPRTVTVERTVTVAASSPSPEASASATASASAAPVADKSCEIGKPCDLGNNNELTIDAIETTKTLTSDLYSPKQGHFVVVDYTYTYNGSSATTMQDYPWIVRDDQGRTYQYDFELTNYYVDDELASVYAEFKPGIAQHGQVIFEVAPDSTGMTLYVTDPLLPQGADSASIDI